MTYLIIGLGNPDKKYDLTRHNTGFMALDSVIDSIISDFGISIDLKQDTKHKAITGKISINNEVIVFAKPLSYMNLSGGPTKSIMDFYKIPLENVIVIHDELDLPTGQVKYKVGGGNAGHNGLKDISAKCGNAVAEYKVVVSENASIPVTKIDTLTDSITLKKDQKWDLEYYIYPSFATEDISITTEDDNIVSIEGNTIEGREIGETTLLFESDKVIQKINISVEENTQVSISEQIFMLSI